MTRSKSTSWELAPNDFSYPWGAWWRRNQGGFATRAKRPRPKYKMRRATAFESKMFARYTSTRKPNPDSLGIHPDQLTLF